MVENGATRPRVPGVRGRESGRERRVADMKAAWRGGLRRWVAVSIANSVTGGRRDEARRVRDRRQNVSGEKWRSSPRGARDKRGMPSGEKGDRGVESVSRCSLRGVAGVCAGCAAPCAGKCRGRIEEHHLISALCEMRRAAAYEFAPEGALGAAT